MPDLNDFKYSDIHQWEQQVRTDLGSEDISQILQIQLSEGIVQSPYVDFTTATEERLEYSYRNTALSPQGNHHNRAWLNLAYFTHGDPEVLNKAAVEALSGGADGIFLEISEHIDHQILFKDITLPNCYLALQGPYHAVSDLCRYLAAYQPVLKGFVSVNDLVDVLGDNNKLLSRPEFDSPLKTLVIRESNGKRGTLEEVSRLLSQGILVINTLLEAGIPLPVILQNIQFSVEVGSQYLWEICRLRALRILFHQVIRKYGSDLTPVYFPIHVFTSDLFLKQDHQEHHSHPLISSTTQAMSAILGGCNSLSVVPSGRIARNISHIVKEESSFHRVTDPVAGSYYLEDLTHKMMKHIWQGLQELEKKGGYRYSTTQK